MQNDMITEAKDLIDEVRRLLAHSNRALDEDQARIHMEQLEWWLESYRHGLSAAKHLSVNGDIFLKEIRAKLTFSLQEMQRLQDEGKAAVPVSGERRHPMDDLCRALVRIDQLITALHKVSFTLPEPRAA